MRQVAGVECYFENFLHAICWICLETQKKFMSHICFLLWFRRLLWLRKIAYLSDNMLLITNTLILKTLNYYSQNKKSNYIYCTEGQEGEIFSTLMKQSHMTTRHFSKVLQILGDTQLEVSMLNSSFVSLLLTCKICNCLLKYTHMAIFQFLCCM